MGISGAVIGAIAAVAGTTTGIIAGNQSRAAARHANDLQEQAASEQRASNAGQAAQAARDQYRQDRIRRARIMQSSLNTGTDQSSGELGALGSLQTQFNTNEGSIQGNYERGVTIGNLNEQAAQSIFEGNSRAQGTQALGSIFSTVGSVAMGASKSYFNKIPGTTSQKDTSFDNPNDYG